MMLDIAIAFAEAGLSVHWLRKRSKAPFTEGWSQAPFQTPDMLRQTYQPGYNLGLRPGEPSNLDGHYLHVLDVDVKDDAKKAEAAEYVRNLLGDDLDLLPAVRSGSGGASRHLYFFAPEPLRNGKLKVAPGWEVDLKSTGANLVLPPSIHPDTGNPYEWVRELDLDMLEFCVRPDLSSVSLANIKAAGGKANAAADDSLSGLLEAAAAATRRDMTLAEAKLYLDRIPEADVEDYDRWRDVGMALHFQFDGDPDALALWDEWSLRAGNYQAGVTEQKWASFSLKPGGVTFGTVVHLAGGHPSPVELALAAVEDCTSYEEAVQAVAHYQLMDAHMEMVVKAIQSRAGEFQLGKVQPRSVKKDIGESRKAQRKEESNRIADDLETALAKETLRRYYGNGKHLLVTGQLFWVYDRGVWRMHDDQMVRSRVYDVLQTIRANAKEDKRYAALLAYVIESGRDNATNALSDSVFQVVKKRTAVDLFKDPLRFNEANAPAVMNCLNGELWFHQDGGFDVFEHDPDHRFTAQLDVDYDPDATCPAWDAALSDFFGSFEDSPDVVRHLHEVLGYLCQFSRDEAMFLILKGNGANGKTLISRVLQALLGDATHQQDIGSLSDRQDAHMGAALVGKLVMIDDDYKKGAPLPDDMIKKLSEGKRMTANPKHGKTFNFVARATPMILTNSWPSTRDGSFGIDRRARVFKFVRQFEDHEKDASLPARIVEQELPGVLNHLVAGFRRFRARGYFDVPPSCTDAFREWKRASNIVAQFAGEALRIVDDAEPIPAHQVLEHFRAWAAFAELGVMKMGKSRFYEELAAVHGVNVMSGSRTRYLVHGVELASFDEGDEEAENLFQGVE